MFDPETSPGLDLTVAERGHGAGHALPAFPLCCCLVLCVALGCSSSCAKANKAE
ncbi:MAG TPA: hypothetical protein VFJ77_11565 [Gaiellaceae bacterium]|nr:hypothetical protein [Gaiellaceae bacterium]